MKMKQKSSKPTRSSPRKEKSNGKKNKKLMSAKKEKEVLVKTPKKEVKISRLSRKNSIIEIIKEYNLSKNEEVFEAKVKKIAVSLRKNKCLAENFKDEFSQFLTKAYVKSKQTCEFTQKDLKFIKRIINKVLSFGEVEGKEKKIKEKDLQENKEPSLQLRSRYLLLILAVFGYPILRKERRMHTISQTQCLLFAME